jgi:beta-propeller uncharacterized protein DUF5122
VQQADGKLVAAGTTGGVGTSGLALVRYEPDGSVDPSFGTGTGAVLTPGGEAQASAQQADGKLLAAGFRTGFLITCSRSYAMTPTARSTRRSGEAWVS